MRWDMPVTFRGVPRLAKVLFKMVCSLKAVHGEAVEKVGIYVTTSKRA
jgi:hypothetical protein